MRVLQVLVLIFAFFIIGKAQIDCIVDNKIIVQDYDGMKVSNAKVDLLKVGKNFTRTKIFSIQQNENGEFRIRTVNARILTETEQTFYINENYRLRINAENFKETEIKIEFKRCESKPIKIDLEKIKQDIKITGVVFDPSGAIIVGASVIATDKNGQIFETKTNNEGIYLLKLFPDTYKLVFEYQGFKKLIIEDFDVVNSTYGKIFQDVVLKIINDENCGAGGCIQDDKQPIKVPTIKPAEKILQKPLENYPKVKKNKEEK